MSAEGRSIQELKIGDAAETSRTITETVIEDFAKATGDFNPLHLDQAYAEKTFFKGRIAHGALSIGLLSKVSTGFLGPGAIALSQEIKFLAPARLGDTITARVEVIEVIPEKNRVKLRTTCTNQNGEVVVDGTAWGMPPKK
jgi:3-hydroxybutyryl-CoA dehydratase